MSFLPYSIESRCEVLKCNTLCDCGYIEIALFLKNIGWINKHLNIGICAVDMVRLRLQLITLYSGSMDETSKWWRIKFSTFRFKTNISFHGVLIAIHMANLDLFTCTDTSFHIEKRERTAKCTLLFVFVTLVLDKCSGICMQNMT